MRVPIHRFSSADSQHAEVRHAVHDFWCAPPRRIIREAYRLHFGLALHPSSVRVSYFTMRAILTDRDVEIRRGGFMTIMENCGCRCERSNSANHFIAVDPAVQKN